MVPRAEVPIRARSLLRSPEGTPLENFEAILAALKSPLEPERERAIQALVRSPDVRAVNVLQQVSSSDESVAVRYLAKKGLFFLRKQLGLEQLPESVPPPAPGVGEESGAASKAGDDPGLKRLAGILAGGDDDQKIRLFKALCQKKLTRALPILLAHDPSGESPEVRSNLVLAVGILGSDDELPYLRNFLEDGDPRVRANAVEALEVLGTPKAYPLVVKMLGDADNRIRANAIKALRHYGKGNCLALLERMVQSKKLWMRDSAAYALSLVGGEESLPLLIQVARDPEPSVRGKALQGLRSLADKGSAEAKQAVAELGAPAKGTLPSHSIEAFFSDMQSKMSFVVPDDDPLYAEDPQERLQAVREIAETRDLDRLPALIDAMRKEGDGFVRAKMVVEAGRIAGPDQFDSLREFLADPVDRVRANAIESLVGLDRKRAQPFVVPLLDDANNRVRANAVIALKDFAHVNILPTLEKMVASDQVLMRKSAFYAITDLGRADACALVERFLDDPDDDLCRKSIGFVEMSADEGAAWAVKLRERLDAEDAKIDFHEFQPQADEDTSPTEAVPAPVSSRKEADRASAEGARERLARFRGLDVEGKRRMIEEAKKDVCLETFFFLREAVEDPNFEVKILAKMALRNFDEDMVQAVEEGTGELSAMFRPPEVKVIEYRGLKKATELNKELNVRMNAFESRGYWEGRWPNDLPMLNALREDTSEMLAEVVGDEAVQKAYLCYQSEKLLPFRLGKKTLDSNRYSSVVGLGQVTSRLGSGTFHGSFIHSLKRPVYLLAVALETRLVLFLRGSLETTQASWLEVRWMAVEAVEAEKVDTRTSLHIQTMGVLVDVPELAPDEAKWVYERAKAREDSFLGHQIVAKGDADKEMRRLELLRSGGIISEAEYRTRKTALDKKR